MGNNSPVGRSRTVRRNHACMIEITVQLMESHENTFFFFNDTATTEIYTLSLHDALPISALETAIALAVSGAHVTFSYRNKEISRPKPQNIEKTQMLQRNPMAPTGVEKPTSERSEEHTSELQSQSNLVCRLLLEKKSSSSVFASSAIAPGSVAPPTKLVNSTWLSGERPGKRDEFQTVPRIRMPADRGTRNPKPLSWWATLSRAYPSETTATGANSMPPRMFFFSKFEPPRSSAVLPGGAPIM